MSQAEFVEWQAYYQQEPFGGERADFHAALISAVITNVTRALLTALSGKRQRKKEPVKASQFMPDWWKPRDDGSGHAAGLLAKMKMLTGSSAEEIEPSGRTRDTIRQARE